MTNASPPGEPDQYDLTRLTGWQPLDIEALKQRQLYLAKHYRTALLLWAAMVVFCLFSMIFTGSLLFWVLGYAVTLPFVVVCYRYKRAIDNAIEFQALCDLNDWC